MKTICFLADARSPHTRKWVMACASLKCRLVVISHHPGEIPGAEVIVHPLSLVGFFRWALSVRRIIRKLQPAVVHAHQFGAHALYAWFSGCRPLVITAWGSDVLLKPKQALFHRCLVSLTARKANLISADSREVVRELQKLGARLDKILYLPFGIRRETFANLKNREQEVDSFIFCSPRLHEPLYNIALILQAFKKVSADFPQAKLWLLGDGSQTYELQKLAADLDIKQVHFWGRVSPEEAQRLIADSQVMISIPSSDATPVSLLEAMAAGSFPILSDLPAYHEWINDEVNGLFIRPEIFELTKAMRRAILDEDMRKQAANANRRIIQEKAIWEDVFQEMLHFYQGALTDS